MNIVPFERFLVVVPVDEEIKSKSFICTTETVEDYYKYRVISIGNEVETDYLVPGDYILAQKKDINIIKYQDDIFYMVSLGFVIKVSGE